MGIKSVKYVRQSIVVATQHEKNVPSRCTINDDEDDDDDDASLQFYANM